MGYIAGQESGCFYRRYGKTGSRALKFVILAFLLFAYTTVQASWPHMSVEEMVKESDLVLIGHVKNRVGEEKNRTYGEITKWKVQVDYYLKGGATVKELIVATPGTEAKTRSTDYALDEQGKQVMLFLSITDGYYMPLTPRGIVALNRSQYNANPKEAITGETVLKQFSIGGAVPEDEREKLESFIESSSPYKPSTDSEDIAGLATGVVRTVVLFIGGMVLVVLSLGRMSKIKNRRK